METYVWLIDVPLRARILFRNNNQAAWRALAKWLKHSSKHCNKTVVKKRRVWHVIRNTLSIHRLETPEMSSHERRRLRMLINIAMHPAIRSYDEQAFDFLSEESENNNFIVKKSLRPVPSQDMVEQAKKKTWQHQTPARLLRKRLKTHRARRPRIT